MPDDAGIRLVADHVVDVLHRLAGLFEQPADDARDDVTGKHEHFLAVHHHMVNADVLRVRHFAFLFGTTALCIRVRRITSGRLRGLPCFICARPGARCEDHIGTAGAEETDVRLRFFSVFYGFRAFDHGGTGTVSEENRGGAVLH